MAVSVESGGIDVVDVKPGSQKVLTAQDLERLLPIVASDVKSASKNMNKLAKDFADARQV